MMECEVLNETAEARGKSLAQVLRVFFSFDPLLFFLIYSNFFVKSILLNFYHFFFQKNNCNIIYMN